MTAIWVTAAKKKKICRLFIFQMELKKKVYTHSNVGICTFCILLDHPDLSLKEAFLFFIPDHLKKSNCFQNLLNPRYCRQLRSDFRKLSKNTFPLKIKQTEEQNKYMCAEFKPTFPVDLTPFQMQKKQMTQTSSKHRARSHLTGPISSMPLLIPSTLCL